jgi:hypothetical protein
VFKIARPKFGLKGAGGRNGRLHLFTGTFLEDMVRQGPIVMANLSSFPWIELAVLPPGQSHYWFFDQPDDLRGWVFQATAHPECGEEESPAAEIRVEVSELFVLCKLTETQGGKRTSQVNLTVTNYSGRWAPYSLWVVAVPPRETRRQVPLPTNRPLAQFLKYQTQASPPSSLKILLVHDEWGNIRSAAIAGQNADRRARLRVQRGESLTEVEEESVDLQELRRNPREFCEKLRLDGTAGRLLPKNE